LLVETSWLGRRTVLHNYVHGSHFRKAKKTAEEIEKQPDGILWKMDQQCNRLINQNKLCLGLHAGQIGEIFPGLK
jgi:hypothetical protein